MCALFLVLVSEHAAAFGNSCTWALLFLGRQASRALWVVIKACIGISMLAWMISKADTLKINVSLSCLCFVLWGRLPAPGHSKVHLQLHIYCKTLEWYWLSNLTTAITVKVFHLNAITIRFFCMLARHMKCIPPFLALFQDTEFTFSVLLENVISTNHWESLY